MRSKKLVVVTDHKDAVDKFGQSSGEVMTTEIKHVSYNFLAISGVTEVLFIR